MENSKKALLVTTSAIIINLATGVLYAWSVFAAALVKDLGFTKTEAQIPYTIGLAMLGFLSVTGGRLQDRFGPRVITTIGGLLIGVGLILASLSNSATGFAIGFGFISGVGIALAYSCTTPASVKWFGPKKRGLITGLVVAGAGLSSVYVAPLTEFLIGKYGVNKSFLVEGIILASVILVFGQLISNPPEGYVPAGSSEQPTGTVVKSSREYTPTEMLATPQFWQIWLMYGFGAVAGLMIIGHMAIIAKIQANVAWAFIFVSILAVFNAGGRVVGGILSDKLGRNKTLIAMFLLQAINMFVFKNYTTVPLLIFGIAVTGIAYGSLLAVFPPLTFDYFGLKNGGVNYGLVFTSWGVAGVIGPIMAGKIVDATKSYNTAYMVAAALLVASLVLVFFLKPPKSANNTIDNNLKI